MGIPIEPATGMNELKKLCEELGDPVYSRMQPVRQRLILNQIMKLFIDTADVGQIREALVSWGL